MHVNIILTHITTLQLKILLNGYGKLSGPTLQILNYDILRILNNMKNEVILARLQMGHNRITHGRLMEQRPKPYCMNCLVPLTGGQL